MSFKCVFSMETGDPDDMMALVLLLGHPDVEIKGVVVTKGAPAQIGLVRHVVTELFQTDLPIGAYDINAGRGPDLQWYYKKYGNIPPSRDAESGPELLARLCDGKTTLISGAPRSNSASIR